MWRIRNSWELVKASWGVLQADRELLVFPLVSFIGTIIVTITFMIPIALTGLFESLANGGDPSSGSSVIGFILAFLFYVVMYSVVVFCNAALIGAANIRLSGGDPTLADGFRIAGQHMGSIIGYAVIAATVGMVLQALRERGGIVGQIVSMIGGLAWNLATFLVIPVLVIEGIGPIEAVQRSAGLLKHTWGEQITGNFSIGLIFTLAAIGVIIVGIPFVAIFAATGSGLLIAVAVIIVVLAVIAVGLFGSTLGGIYQAAVYRYATDGHAGEFFSQEMVSGAFKPKRG